MKWEEKIPIPLIFSHNNFFFLTHEGLHVKHLFNVFQCKFKGESFFLLAKNNRILTVIYYEGTHTLAEYYKLK